jgi:hypothetical protein
MGFVVDKVALGQVFSEYFGFTCQSPFHQILHHYDHPWQVSDKPSGPSMGSTLHYAYKINNKKVKNIEVA